MTVCAIIYFVILRKLSLQGYHKSNFFIVTQAPFPNTMIDMWKMVFEQRACAVVNLAQSTEYEQVFACIMVRHHHYYSLYI